MESRKCKQIKMVTMSHIFKIVLNLLETKQLIHARYSYLMEVLNFFLNYFRISVTIGGPCQPVWFVYQQWKGPLSKVKSVSNVPMIMFFF